MDPPFEQPPGSGPLPRQDPMFGTSLHNLGAGSRHLAGEAVSGVRLHPLEAAVIVLMAIGGPVFPPVWLAGAALATASKAWDLRDKWTGILGPVLIVIAGTALVLVVGGHHHTFGAYVSEAWLSIGRIARFAAVLGACYLTWRLRRGPRPQQLPPWKQTHRLG